MMITVLGINFNSDEERRLYFREALRQHLPDLRQLDGFPIGTDDDIIALSDPPFYTACPNPWLNDFIAEWEAAKIVIARDELSPRAEHGGTEGGTDELVEPYASDVSEGKNNPIYNAHSYHTKVPHPAIMRYILHYTKPGDIVFDGFAGTGMTGVAAQLCANPDAETKFKIEDEFRKQGLKPPVWGLRRAVLGDLSPVASFIAYNYNAPVDVEAFEKEAKRILAEVEAECGWMYETEHIDLKTQKLSKGKINYTVWSDVFTCPDCAGEMVFWDVAVDHTEGKVLDQFPCPHCTALHTKKSVDKTWISRYDTALGEIVRQTKTMPVLINYTANAKRFNKKPTAFDLDLIQKIENTEGGAWFPTDRMPEGDEARRNDRTGITHVHHFYTKRSLLALSKFYAKANLSSFKSLNFVLSGIVNRSTLMNRIHMKNYFFGGGGWNAGYMKGTLYVSSMPIETSIFEQIEDRTNSALKAFSFLEKLKDSSFALGVQSATDSTITENSIDYIFTDPPFGANIMYSELNFLWESWLKVQTTNTKEAIENKIQGKGFTEYTDLMTASFKEYYRILKPNKWMTVEFSNTNAAIWNGIQTALQQAGFIIANVAALDKQQGSFNAVTTPTAVKQDLVISCYKPSTAFLGRFSRENMQNTEGGATVWDFIREHLTHLPIHLRKGNATTQVVERSAKILYDRMISFYILNGINVPLDAAAFQQGLSERFVERDSMYFTETQALQYEQKKAQHPEFIQMSLFEKIETEEEAVLWLRDRLSKKIQTRQDIYTDYIKLQTTAKSKGRLPELDEILIDNFIKMGDDRWRVPDVNEISDLELVRKQKLLKEFRKYAEEASRSKRLKDVRLEALRAGFHDCWERKLWDNIVQVGSRIPDELLYEDEKLYMYFEIAQGMAGKGDKGTLFG